MAAGVLLSLLILAYFGTGMQNRVTAWKEAGEITRSIPQQIKRLNLQRRITIPYISSYVYMAALLVFLASFGDVGAPLIVGGNFLVLPTEAYTRFLSFVVDRRVPVLLASWIVVISVLIMFAVRALMRKTEIAHIFVTEQYEYDVPWMRTVGSDSADTVAVGGRRSTAR